MADMARGYSGYSHAELYKLVTGLSIDRQTTT
jgi:hypothetical protein